MRQSKVEMYVHCVWAVSNRLPLLDEQIERAVHRCIEAEAKRLGCDVLAIGGMPDHVHLLVKMPSRLSLLQLMKQVKGVSSRFIHDRLRGNESLYWQEGYGAFSVSPRHVAAVKEYVKGQKAHHAANQLHAAWEETDEDVAPE